MIHLVRAARFFFQRSQRFLCASLILRRAAADIFRREPLGLPRVAPISVPSSPNIAHQYSSRGKKEITRLQKIFDDLNSTVLKQIEAFFVNYQKVREVKFKIIERSGPKRAIEILRRAALQKDAA